jgi:hypothetical protein
MQARGIGLDGMQAAIIPVARLQQGPKIFSKKVKSALQDRHGEAGDGARLAAVVVQVDFPDLRRATKVGGACHACHPAVAYGAQVVCIHLKPDGIVRGRIQDHVGGDAAQRLGEHDGGATMKDAKGLLRARIDGHAPHEEIGADFEQFQAHMRQHVYLVERPHLGQCIGSKPNGHGAKIVENSMCKCLAKGNSKRLADVLQS